MVSLLLIKCILIKCICVEIQGDAIQIFKKLLDRANRTIFYNQYFLICFA